MVVENWFTSVSRLSQQSTFNRTSHVPEAQIIDNRERRKGKNRVTDYHTYRIFNNSNIKSSRGTIHLSLPQCNLHTKRLKRAVSPGAQTTIKRPY